MAVKIDDDMIDYVGILAKLSLSPEEKDGRKAKTRNLDDEEYRKQLNKKLQEEVKEYLEDNNLEELADIVEVVYGILNSMNVTVDDFEKVRKNKKEKNGGFEKKIYLEEAE